MSGAAVAALSGAVASRDPRAVSVGAAGSVGLAAGAIAAADSAMTAMPSVKAIAATPAKAAAVGVAAPIEARALPTAIVPAEIAAAEDELDMFQRRRIAGSIHPKDQLWRRLGLSRDDHDRSAQQRRRRCDAQEKVTHEFSFNSVAAECRTLPFAP
jgi:hypothetical protein